MIMQVVSAAYVDRTRRYRQRVIAITRGGQTHAALTAQPFRVNQLREISKSVIVNVSTDDLTFEEGASFFASNRADLKRRKSVCHRKSNSKPLLLCIYMNLEGLSANANQSFWQEKEQMMKTGFVCKLDPMIKLFHRSIVRSRFFHFSAEKDRRTVQGCSHSYLSYVSHEPSLYLSCRGILLMSCY